MHLRTYLCCCLLLVTVRGLAGEPDQHIPHRISLAAAQDVVAAYKNGTMTTEAWQAIAAHRAMIGDHPDPTKRQLETGVRMRAGESWLVAPHPKWSRLAFRPADVDRAQLNKKTSIGNDGTNLACWRSLKIHRR